MIVWRLMDCRSKYWRILYHVTNNNTKKTSIFGGKERTILGLTRDVCKFGL